MIRVTKTEERSKAVITIDGELSSESIALVETCCAQAGSSQMPVQLFLRDVTLIDGAGRMMLTRLAVKGIRLAATGLYNSYLVRSLLSAARALRASSTKSGIAEG